jgi:hypothetical protein
MEALLLAIPLPKPKRDRADVLQVERLQTRRYPLRPKRNELPRRSLHRRNRQLLVMSPEPSCQNDKQSCGMFINVQPYQISYGVRAFNLLFVTVLICIPNLAAAST